MDFTTWVNENNIDPAIVSLLEEQDLDNIEDLRDVEAKEVGLTAELEAQLGKALEILKGTASMTDAFVAWATSKKIKAETIEKLKNGGYNDFTKLCQVSEETLKGLQITTGQLKTLKRAIAELKVQRPVYAEPPPAYLPPLEAFEETDFTKFLTSRNIKDDTVKKLLQVECDTKDAIKLMKESHVDKLGLSQGQHLLLLEIISDMQTESAATTKTMTSADAFQQFLKDMGLEEKSITALFEKGYTSLDSLRYAHESDLQVIGLGPNQCEILGDIITELKRCDQVDTPIDAVIQMQTENRKTANAGNAMKADTQQGTTPEGILPTVVKTRQKHVSEANAKPETKSLFSRAWSRFKKSTEATTDSIRSGIENLHSYMSSMGIKTEPIYVKTENEMKIMKLPLRQDYEDKVARVRRCIYGKPGEEEQSKTIMVVGATGAGKSTLIDGLCNYIFGTRWEENYRLKLIDEHEDELKNASKGQAMSQTEWITIYTIGCGDSKILPYTLNIIDTPGFGDTRGITRDKELVGQVEALFKKRGKHGIDSIDAVCFVAKAPDARLTPSQRYIFDSILSIFGNDIGDNILVMITFADGASAPVLEAIEAAKLPHKKAFPFNNSALFANNGNLAPGSSIIKSKSPVNHFSTMFWAMGMSSFKDFFDFLSKMQPKSLSLTRDVLEKRRNLKDTLQFLQEQIKLGLSTMSTLKKEKEIFQQNEQKIKDNQNFKYKTTEHYTEKIDCPAGWHVSHCKHCHNTCHDCCVFSDDDEKQHCSAISNDYCTRCENKCHWTEHKNTGYRLEHRSREIEKTYDNMLAEYEKSTGIKKEKLDIIELTQAKYDQYKYDVKQNVDECRQILKTLRKIALKPDPLSEVQYIDELIEAERHANKPGYEDRIVELRRFKTEAETILKVTRNQQLM